jgi:hypothetical protein
MPMCFGPTGMNGCLPVYTAGCAIVINLIRGRSLTWIVPLTLGIGSIALRLLGVHGLIFLVMPTSGADAHVGHPVRRHNGLFAIRS